MNYKIEDYISERIKQYDLSSNGYELYIDGTSGEVMSLSKGVNAKKLTELVNEIDKKYNGKFIDGYVIYRVKESDGFTPYKIIDLTIQDPHNIRLLLRRVGRNFNLSINSIEKHIRKGFYKTVSEEELSNMFNWHKTNLAKYEDRYLYIFRNEIGRIKIGQAINVNQRMLAIKMQSGLEIELLNKIHGAAHLENKLHKKYKEFRYIGEWFNLPENEIEYLKNLKL